MDIRVIVDHLRILEITRAELNWAQESLLQERGVLLTKLEQANLEKEAREAVAAQSGQLTAPSCGETSHL